MFEGGTVQIRPRRIRDLNKAYIPLQDVLPGTHMVTLSCMQQALRNPGSDPEKILLLGRRIAGRIFYCHEN
jgi:hypothetical protein